MSQGLNKITAERNQRTLLELATQPGNDMCADCKNRNPRWASYNLGIFICVHCASIHRKMGTHISKVKSLTMDSWTKEQVEVMKSNGNVKSNAHFNPDETRHPPPTNMIDSERDSELEKYIRYKYEYKKFVSRSSQVAALLGPSRSVSSRLTSTTPSRSQTTPVASAPSSSSSAPISSLPSSSTTSSTSPADALRTSSQIRSVSQPVAPSAPPAASSQLQAQVQARPATQPPQQQLSNPLWNDLAQLQAPAADSSLPLQFAPTMSAATQPINIPTLSQTNLSAPNQFSGLSVSPINPFPSNLAQQQTGMYAQRSMSLNTGLSMNPGLSPNLSVSNMGMQMSMSMTGSPSPMFQPQPTMGGMSGSAAPYAQNATPSPSPYQQQQPSFAPSSFGASPQPQGSPMFSTQVMPQGSPMFSAQMQMQTSSSPMFQMQQLQPQPGQMGSAFMQQQPQQGMGMNPSMGTPFGTPQPSFTGAPVYGQQQQPQQMMYGQSAFGGTGWQQGAYPGQPQQQQWGGM